MVHIERECEQCDFSMCYFQMEVRMKTEIFHALQIMGALPPFGFLFLTFFNWRCVHVKFSVMTILVFNNCIVKISIDNFPLISFSIRPFLLHQSCRGHKYHRSSEEFRYLVLLVNVQHEAI